MTESEKATWPADANPDCPMAGEPVASGVGRECSLPVGLWASVENCADCPVPALIAVTNEAIRARREGGQDAYIFSTAALADKAFAAIERLKP